MKTPNGMRKTFSIYSQIREQRHINPNLATKTSNFGTQSLYRIHNGSRNLSEEILPESEYGIKSNHVMK